MGPSTLTDNHEYIDREDCAYRDEATMEWREGNRSNPYYRKLGCDMVVDTQSGEVSWIESDRLDYEATLCQGEHMGALLAHRLATRLRMRFGPEELKVGMERWARISAYRQPGESWEQAYNRSQETGYWSQILNEFPDPDKAALGYQNMSKDEFVVRMSAQVREEGLEFCRKNKLPLSWVDRQRELVRHEKLASLEALKFTNGAFMDYFLPDEEPYVIRLEFDRPRGTLLVRIDNRPESFRFEGVSPDAWPFVNLYTTEDGVTLLHDYPEERAGHSGSSTGASPSARLSTGPSTLTETSRAKQRPVERGASGGASDRGASNASSATQGRSSS